MQERDNHKYCICLQTVAFNSYPSSLRYGTKLADPNCCVPEFWENLKMLGCMEPQPWLYQPWACPGALLAEVATVIAEIS